MKCLTNKIRVLLVVILTTLSLAATAQERIALVIGNSNYEISPLANTLNDAQDIAETLKELDFSVTTVIDGNRTEMIKAIRAFGKSLDKKTIALFYYAGHGVQYNGENYLIPVGALPEITERRYLNDEAVTLSTVTEEITLSGSKLNFVFLDACRNNPIPVGDRGIVKGLIKKGAEGMIISYAAAEGEAASDGDKSEGGNSPYTKALLELMIKPNVTIEATLKSIRTAVRAATHNKQSPDYASSIGEGDFCFKVEGEGCGINIIIQNTIVDNPFLKGVDNIQLVELEDGSSYVGQIIGSNTPQGKGVMTLANGNQIEGEWHSGNISKGKITMADGAHYEGEIQNRQMHGQGVLTSAEVGRYEGEFKNGLMDGQGEQTQAGNEYKGEFEDGIFIQGQVVHAYPDGTRYEGGWKDGMLNGQGVETYSDGTRYEGGWKDGKRNGQGVETHSDGARYEGEWINGQPNGQGVYTFASGARYEGESKDGKRNGQGVETYSDGARYEGEFKDNLFNGQGVMTWPDGARYEGEYQDDEFNGQGVMTYFDGARYEGEWQDDKRNGQGVMTYPDGTRFEGEWVDGRLGGQGIYTSADGSQEQEVWENGELISSEPL